MIKTTLLSVLFLISTQVSFAQWDGNPAVVNNVVSNASIDERKIFSVTDGAGGALIAWESNDYEIGVMNIYMQRKTASGALSWSVSTAPLLIASSTTSYLHADGGIGDLVSDGAGGAYISWIDKLSEVSADMYVQRISNNGAMLFTPGGIKVNQTNGHEYSDARLCADDAGVIICWTDQVQGSRDLTIETGEVFAQRYNLSGNPQWTAGGVKVSSVVSHKGLSHMVTDGANGAFICFSDARNSSMSDNGFFDKVDIYAQHISSAGAKLWGVQDAVVSNVHDFQYTQHTADSRKSMIADSGGGFVLVYRSDNTLYAQRMAVNGARLWATPGVALSGDLSKYMGNYTLDYSVSKGLVAVWDQFYFTEYGGDVHAQNITPNGAVNWGVNGILVSAPNIPNFYYNTGMSTMAADGKGNYVINWTSYDTVYFHFEIKGQKLNGLGQRLWGDTGVDICVNPKADAQLPIILRSNNDSMIVAWEDTRTSAESNFDIYAAKIDPNGKLVNTITTSYATTKNGNWNDPSIWAGNAVPPSGADIIIRHTVIANINVSCKSIKVEPGVSFNINPGINITLLQ